jgi:uncharacterized membrane protein (DUF441 family)
MILIAWLTKSGINFFLSTQKFIGGLVMDDIRQMGISKS